ncbi:MAG: hypothetical protein LBQ88_06540 [Treponema sp.]|jgi:hypothetical protein|nr:hypothetical protein [Treponema sp.]
MSLIDLSLSDKERILFYANKCPSRKDNIFNTDRSASSLYVDLDESNQIFPDIMEYDIDTIKDFRNFLKKMWQNMPDSDLLINIIMAAAYKNRGTQNNFENGNTNTVTKVKENGNSTADGEILSLTRYAF